MEQEPGRPAPRSKPHHPDREDQKARTDPSRLTWALAAGKPPDGFGSAASERPLGSPPRADRPGGAPGRTEPYLFAHFGTTDRRKTSRSRRFSALWSSRNGTPTNSVRRNRVVPQFGENILPIKNRYLGSKRLNDDHSRPVRALFSSAILILGTMRALPMT